MAVAFSNSSSLGESVKFFGGGIPQAAPVGGGNNSAIPNSTSLGVLTNAGSDLANFATNGSPSPLVALAGMVLLLILLKYSAELKSTAIDPADLHIGAYNLLAVTITAIVGIASFKLIFNSIHLPGITPLVNFV